MNLRSPWKRAPWACRRLWSLHSRLSADSEQGLDGYLSLLSQKYEDELNTECVKHMLIKLLIKSTRYESKNMTLKVEIQSWCENGCYMWGIFILGFL